MTLEEAIEHLQEILNDAKHNWSCEKCKSEHKQLLEWLTELQKRRLTMENIERKAVIEKLNEIGGCNASDNFSKGWDKAIDAAIEAVTQIPLADDKTPDKNTPWSKRAPFDPGSITCGRCDSDISEDDFEYCPYCGQKLDWSCLSDSETSFEMDGKIYNVFFDDDCDDDYDY